MVRETADPPATVSTVELVGEAVEETSGPRESAEEAEASEAGGNAVFAGAVGEFSTEVEAAM